jgi:NADP-dependent 3-hydroxy acid dehydrogenase YdfG
MGNRLLLADVRVEDTEAAANAIKYDVRVATVDVSSRDAVYALVEKAKELADVTSLIHAAGVSPSHAPPATILRVDLNGTALVLEVAALGIQLTTRK